MMSTCCPSALEAKTCLAYEAVHNIASTDFHARFFAFGIYACQTTLWCPLIVYHTIGLSMILFVADETEGFLAISALKVPKFRRDYIENSRTIHCRTEEHVLVEDQRVDQASFVIEDECLFGHYLPYHVVLYG